MITARIFAEGDPEHLMECFAPEDMSFDRSSFTINRKDNGVEFVVESKDAVALRATLNSISQLLVIFESAGKG
ncbi:hypothetical protein KY362_08165 [Candidatus Woesearchaeota archaeon]|nr:hypothetical protein [Candidatus Woesearchaeota archaeon]